MKGGQEYLNFFGLREQPFAPTADPVYFYATAEHKECLFRLWSGVDERHGVSVVLGNYGTGKTTLLRKLLSGMAADPECYNTAVIGSPIPSWTSFALLETIVTQFGLQPEPRSFMAYMNALFQYLLRNRERVNTLVIDDAQNLNKRGQVELLRLVQNLETPRHKLLNLLLFAQLEWMPVLRAVPNFEQRVNMTFTLSALNFEETCRFIQFRLKQAGAPFEGKRLFDEGALRAIFAYAEGSPRVTVTLCRNALLIASQIKKAPIGADIILHTMEKTTLPDPARRARVVAALHAESPLKAGPTAAPEAEDLPPARPYSRAKRDQQASELLLRAARAREGDKIGGS